jgi:two-component system, sensor histidine kinase
MRVVVVTPQAADGELARGFLEEAGFSVAAHSQVAGIASMDLDDIGCLVLVDECLADPDLPALQEALQKQSAWSDLPIVLVARDSAAMHSFGGAYLSASGNLTLLQRPLHPASLVSATKVALRSRQRQYQVRVLLEQRERALKQRDEFLAMLAHELRNPLAPIRNAVYLLGTLEVKEPLFVKCRAMIEKQARHITQLVDDLLEVSRLELGKVELRKRLVDLNEILVAAVDATAMVMGSRNHVLQLSPAVGRLPVHADPLRIEQALGNIIANAAKFTPNGGAIRIETYPKDGHAVVAVSDNGIGVKPDMIDSIFELFTQDSATIDRGRGGLGIGLTLVKRLVELHGGQVHAFSEGPGRGSRFEIRLALARDEEARATPASRAHAAGPRKVLVVEDGADTRESLGMLMTAWKHEVLYAADGPEGVRLACEAQPDVAVIDIGLPGLNGYEVARSIRRAASTWAHPVRLIALTGYGQASDRERAAEAGFDVHLLKPVDPDSLLHELLAGAH